ncbi:transcription antitermination factor NusB [Haliovirga abyssi]|uniref:Transcription antitermination protein NusB n=1 Tax=Haliovirga abyssi TaxID=2996794 RepID=A0AAU9DXG1_9FUSO|nr:transcription antitermination factor NusB [Haliovirga abyssi]BDU50060.1 N utilization substance protein B [Haliovirga abyssi]
MARKKSREDFFKLMFEADSKGVMPIELYEDFINREEKFVEDEKEFIISYSKNISENMDNIDKKIQENMKNWRLGRIGIVERALLRLAIYEIVYEKIGIEIVINEVIEIAKVYGDEKSHEFINGVLANIVN